MNSQITITKQTATGSGSPTLLIHISASKEDALELLSYGTRNIMDSMGITLTDFLEALMNAKETPSICRTVMDTSCLAQLEQQTSTEH